MVKPRRAAGAGGRGHGRRAKGGRLGARKCLALALVLAQVAGLAHGARSQKHELWAWGSNTAGQLGLTDVETRKTPSLVTEIQEKRVLDLAVGGSEQIESQVLALMKPGRLYTTGDNSFGQLGLGHNLDRDTFTPVSQVFSKRFVRISAGEAHSAALTDDGKVFVWGGNAHGQLGGIASSSQGRLPAEVHIAGGEKLVGVECGAWHTVVWTDKGNVYAWGDNTYGQLGVGDTSPRSDPTPLDIPKQLAIRTIVAGSFHTFLVTTEGKLYSWGRNSHGQLGQKGEIQYSDVHSPKLMYPFSNRKVTQIAAGSAHTLVLLENGVVYGFGDNSALQLGLVVQQTPEPTPLRTPKTFKDISCAKLHCVAASFDGKIYTWGTDTYGQLGLGDSKRSQAVREPTLVRFDHHVDRVYASTTGTYAITNLGELHAWGKNNAGQLGIKSSRYPKSFPAVVVKISNDTDIKSLSAGGYAYQYEAHSALVMSNYNVHIWGWNLFGQLGSNDGESQGIPKKNAWLSKQKLKTISCGQFSTAAITEDGDLFMWGLNEAGQLGRGDFSLSQSVGPHHVPIDGRVASVSIGYGHVLALTEHGEVFSWGKNFYGQLGLGDHRDKSSPQQVFFAQDDKIVQVDRIIRVVAGQYHSLALSEAGTVYAWGYNRDYELGLNDNMDRVYPQRINSLAAENITQIAAGGYHTLAISGDGRLFSWGLNNYGQLGRLAIRKGKVPASAIVTSNVKYGKPSGDKLVVTQIAAGTWHSLAVAENGQAYAWGRCHQGQIGSPCTGESLKRGQQFAVRVQKLEDKEVLKIAAGAAHSLAVARPTR